MLNLPHTELQHSPSTIDTSFPPVTSQQQTAFQMLPISNYPRLVRNHEVMLDPLTEYNQGKWRVLFNDASAPFHICSDRNLFEGGLHGIVPCSGVPWPTFNGMSVEGFGSVALHIQSPEDGQCNELQLKHVAYIPTYVDTREPEIHNLMIVHSASLVDGQRLNPLNVLALKVNTDNGPDLPFLTSWTQNGATLALCERSGCRRGGGSTAAVIQWLREIEDPPPYMQ